MFRRILLALLAAPLLAAASAQSLADLAPAETVVALSFEGSGIPFDSLPADLAALDWEGAADTVMQYVAALTGEPGGMPGGLGEFGMAMDEFEGAMAELEEVCPALAETVPAVDPQLLDEGLIAVSVSPFNPLPAVTALARVGDAATATALQEALVGCFAEAEPFEQDGVDLWLLGDGGEFPLIVGTVDGVAFATSNPDVARGVVRRARGGDEPAFADAPLWQQRAAFEGAGLGLAVDFAAVADLIEAFVPRGMAGPEGEVAIDRGVAALRTLGGYAGELSAPAEGLLFEGALAVDRDGGDDDLADLLLCSTCAVSRPFLAPADAVAVASESFPLRGIVRYVENLIDEVAAAAGEETTLRDVLAEEFGVDLDVLLLDWIGEQVHTVVLEPFGADLGTLLYGQEQAVIVPVASAEAAERGLLAIGDLLTPFEEEIATVLGGGTSGLAGFVTGLSAGMMEADGMPSASGVAVREASYRDVPYRRVQAGLALDVAVALVGNNLVLAFPSAALEPIVDTYLGGENILGEPAYRAAVAAAPAGATEVAWGAPESTALRGLADIATLLSQPAAAASQLAAEAALNDPFGDDFGDFGGPEGELVPLYDLDVGGFDATPLEAGAGIDATLTDAETNAFGEVADYYALGPIPDGAEVSVVMTSDEFDTYLRLVDPEAGTVLLENDDAPDTSRSELSFTASGDRSYWVEVGSYFGDSTGAFELSVSVVGGDAADDAAAEDAESTEPEAAEVPAFAELLEVAELPGETLAVIADHLGDTVGWSAVADDAVVFRYFTGVRW